MQSSTTVTPARQRAAVIHGTRDLRVDALAVPTPQAGEALVQVRAVGICGSDFGYLSGAAKYPVKAPFVLGHEASGVIAGLGEQTTDAAGSATPLAVGTRVALVPGSSCGECDSCLAGWDNLCPNVTYLGSAATDPHVDGALQEYLVVPVGRLIAIPDSVSDAAAALLEPLAVAEHAVRRGQVSAENVLVVGGGAIGQLLALCARAAGAAEVTICETQERRRQLALDHGTDHAVDPAGLEALMNDGAHYDVVLDATGNPAVLDLGIRATTPGDGRLIIVGNLPADTGLPAETVRRAEIWVTATFRFPAGLDRALELVTSGLDIDWLVERSADLDGLDEALAAAASADPPLKIQVSPNPAPTP